MFRMWGAGVGQGGRRSLGTLMLPHVLFYSWCLAETTLVCLSVFPGMAIKHGRLREIRLT